MFATSFVLQAASETIGTPRGYEIGFGILVASYVLLIAFCARNVIHTGMAVVMLGIAINAVVYAFEPIAAPILSLFVLFFAFKLLFSPILGKLKK